MNNKVKEYRRTMPRMTQRRLAKLVNVSRQTIIAIEKGQVPSVVIASKLARILRVPVETLFPNV